MSPSDDIIGDSTLPVRLNIVKSLLCRTRQTFIYIKQSKFFFLIYFILKAIQKHAYCSKLRKLRNIVPVDLFFKNNS